MQSGTKSRSPTHPSCQQLSHPSIQLTCFGFDTQDRQHIFCVTTKEASLCQFRATLLPLGKSVRAPDPSTLRNGDTSFCALHVPSTRVRRSVLHWVQEKTWHPQHHKFFTIHRIISHWIVCCSWIFWIWIFWSYRFGPGWEPLEDSESGIAFVLFPLGFM